jgi:DMSO/TMAO reductase YedYZ molybdopterin-dependent catalytic subunit
MAFGLLLFSSFAGVFADSNWVLTINGVVSSPLNLTLADLAAMPNTTEFAVLGCYGQVVAVGDWTGVRLGLLLEQAGLDQGAVSVDFYAQDGYHTNLPIDTAMQDDVIVAYEMNDQPLSETLRLVIPGANGDQWIAWITSISVSMSPSPPLPTAPEPTPTPTPPPTPPPIPTPSPTPSPAPKSQPKNETVTPPTDTQPQEQQGSSGLSLPAEYSYPIVFAAIAVTAAVAGYLIYKYRR